MRRFLLLILMLTVQLSACGKDDPADPVEPVQEEGMSVSVRLVDAAQDPVAGLEMGLANVLPELPAKSADKAAGATILFYLPYRAHALLTILDEELRTVRVLVDRDRDPDLYTEVWDGTDDQGDPVASARYKVLLLVTMIGSGSYIFSDSHYLYLAQPRTLLGPTDSGGRIVLRDRALFPQFYGVEDMLCLDEEGAEVIPAGRTEPYFTLTSLMRFFCLDPATGAVQEFTAEVDAADASLLFVWDPPEKDLAAPAEATEGVAVEDLKRIPDDWTLFPPYPNPFLPDR